MNNYIDCGNMISLGLTCDICGKTVKSVTYVNDIKYCHECYTKNYLYNLASTNIKLNNYKNLTNKDKEIKKLKQQLVEKDEKIELLKDNRNQKVIKCLKEVEKIIYEDFTITKDSKAIKYIDNKIKELEEE